MAALRPFPELDRGQPSAAYMRSACTTILRHSVLFSVWATNNVRVAADKNAFSLDYSLGDILIGWSAPRISRGLSGFQQHRRADRLVHARHLHGWPNARAYRCFPLLDRQTLMGTPAAQPGPGCNRWASQPSPRRKRRGRYAAPDCCNFCWPWWTSGNHKKRLAPRAKSYKAVNFLFGDQPHFNLQRCKFPEPDLLILPLTP